MRKHIAQFILTGILACLNTLTMTAGEIYVSPTGNDQNEGTAGNPLKSPGQALRMAREWRRTGDRRAMGGINIILRGGEYYMVEPLFIRPEDSGTEQSPTIIRGAEGEQAVLCGDKRAMHTQVFPDEGMERLIDFNPKDRTITIPTPPDWRQSGVPRLKGLEMVVHQRWAIAILRVKGVRVKEGQTTVIFKEPESRLEFEHPWPQPVIGGERGNSSFLLRTTEQREGIERLVVVSGTEKDTIQHITFRNLHFRHTCWNRPLRQGHVTLQGGVPIIDAYKLQREGLPWAPTLENQAWVERPVAAVSVRWARYVDFRGCHFEDLAATALDYEVGVSDCEIADNSFEDIGGTAILAGSFAESPREVHRPYPNLASQCQRLRISGNTIHDATNEDWGAVGIGCGYVRDITIEGNVVDKVNYSGICVGWGWTPLDMDMENNRIIGNTVRNFARQLYDAGGIYTLSNQPNSLIKDNRMERLFPAPYATNYRGFAIYLDAMTDGYTLEGNTLDGRPIRRQQIGTNNPGSNIVWKE